MNDTRKHMNSTVCVYTHTTMTFWHMYKVCIHTHTHTSTQHKHAEMSNKHLVTLINQMPRRGVYVFSIIINGRPT